MAQRVRQAFARRQYFGGVFAEPGLVGDGGRCPSDRQRVAIVRILHFFQFANDLRLGDDVAKTQSSEGILLAQRAAHHDLGILLHQVDRVPLGKVAVGFVNQNGTGKAFSERQDCLARDECAGGTIGIG